MKICASHLSRIDHYARQFVKLSIYQDVRITSNRIVGTRYRRNGAGSTCISYNNSNKIFQAFPGRGSFFLRGSKNERILNEKHRFLTLTLRCITTQLTGSFIAISFTLPKRHRAGFCLPSKEQLRYILQTIPKSSPVEVAYSIGGGTTFCSMAR